jgi:hypothetical protein
MKALGGGWDPKVLPTTHPAAAMSSSAPTTASGSRTPLPPATTRSLE